MSSQIESKDDDPAYKAMLGRIDALYGISQYHGSSESEQCDSDANDVVCDETPYVATARTKGEVLLDELPPPKELKFDEEQLQTFTFQPIGKVHSVVDNLVVIAGAENSPVLDECTALFVHSGLNKTPLGEIFEVFGPAFCPFYVVRLQNTDICQQLDLIEGKQVFFVANSEEFSRFVFTAQLEQAKPSDASNLDDNAVECLDECDFSDDEEERKAKSLRKQKLLSEYKAFDKKHAPREPMKPVAEKCLGPLTKEAMERAEKKQTKRQLKAIKTQQDREMLSSFVSKPREPTVEEVAEMEALKFIKTSSQPKADEEEDLTQMVTGLVVDDTDVKGPAKKHAAKVVADSSDEMLSRIQSAVSSDKNMANKIMALVIKNEMQQSSSQSPSVGANKPLDSRFVRKK